jgi:FlaA1/EpsC-like NDP-sugar epimerase
MRFIRTRLVQMLIDAFVVATALLLAYAIRFDGTPPGIYRKQFFLVLPYLVILRIAVLGLFHVHRLSWRFVTMRDLPRIVGATLTGSAVLVLARFVALPLTAALGLVVIPRHVTVPFSVMAMEFILSTAGIVAVRAMWRLAKEEVRRKGNGQTRSRTAGRALVIGAGSAGVMVAREVNSKPDAGFRAVGFLDDDRNKHGTIIHGLPVLGSPEQLPQLSRKLEADVAIIAIGNAPAPAVRRIVELAETTSMRVQIIPELNEILSGRVSISQFRDVDIADLLRRDPVELDEQLIGDFVTGKTVLVTGAGGSIGAEICRQVSGFDPRSLVLLDRAENPLFHIHRELQNTFPETEIDPRVGNVTDRDRMREVLEQVRPDVVFHAAAHKHVPLMEANPGEAIRNNVGGSRLMADLAHEFGVEAFVMISTDKAVNPTSVMGATKRLAEIYVQALAARSSTRFITVRFGNVLDSEGSVVPLFREQIARGGPVRVTHPDMKRYFMTIPEASRLVLQASAMGKGGEIFVLEMGQPIRIVDLAQDLIRLSGFRPGQDIEIVFGGIRPGEKLMEEINLSEENATKTRHPRIWIGESAVADLKRTGASIDRLLREMSNGSSEDVRRALEAVVPEYVAWSPPSATPKRPRPKAGNNRTASRMGKEATLPSSA